MDFLSQKIDTFTLYNFNTLTHFHLPNKIKLPHSILTLKTDKYI